MEVSSERPDGSGNGGSFLRHRPWDWAPKVLRASISHTGSAGFFPYKQAVACSFEQFTKDLLPVSRDKGQQIEHDSVRSASRPCCESTCVNNRYEHEIRYAADYGAEKWPSDMPELVARLPPFSITEDPCEAYCHSSQSSPPRNTKRNWTSGVWDYVTQPRLMKIYDTGSDQND